MIGTIRRVLPACLLAIVGVTAATPASAATVLQGQSASIVFTATSASGQFDFMLVTLNFATGNPFGGDETFTYKMYNSANQLIGNDEFYSSTFAYTSGANAAVFAPLNFGSQLGSKKFTLVVTAATGSFDLTSATANYGHSLTSGASQSNVAGVITFPAAAPAVPEPATWGLMLLGFGGVGYTLRRRSAKIASPLRTA